MLGKQSDRAANTCTCWSAVQLGNKQNWAQRRTALFLYTAHPSWHTHLTRDGHALCVQQVPFPCGGCSSSCGILTAASGTVSDGPSHYADNAYCKWIIAPTSAARITITFTEFNTESGYDYVTLSSCTDVNCATKQQIFRSSGTTLPSSLTPETGFLMVEFSSDSSVVMAGFSATWTVRASPSECCNADIVYSSNVCSSIYIAHAHASCIPPTAVTPYIAWIMFNVHIIWPFFFPRDFVDLH
jgi:hypothetical protein